MIASIIPRPRRLDLGGRSWLASEFRLADLAAIQGWLADLAPDPFDAAAARLGGRRDADWKRTLATTLAARESWPVAFDSDAAGSILDSPEGSRVQLVFSLRREHPGFDDEAAERLRLAMTVGEYERFARVAWGIDPALVMARLVDGPEPPGQPVDWVACWYRYLETARGPAPPFGDLTITQFRAWLGGGKLPDGTATDRPDWMELARRRAEFWAEID